MNKVVLIVALLFSTIASAQKAVDSRITNVTVFLNRAQVTRMVKTRVEAGKSDLVFQGLTSELDPQSIQVAAKGNFTILGIVHQQNFRNEFNLPRGLKLLRDSLTTYTEELTTEQNFREILNKEEAMLISNQKIGGTTQNLTASELKAMADFYRSRLNDIAIQRIKQDTKIKKLQERISRLQKQIAEQNELYSRNTSEIVVSIEAASPSQAEIEMNYIVGNAGWIPVYDLRAIDTKRPVQLQYKANVYQRTGEEWDNVKLTLSTANPSLGGSKPVLSPWYLDFPAPVVRRGVRYRTDAPAAASPAYEQSQADTNEVEEAKSVADFTTTIQTSLNTQFAISLPYTVRSAAKPTLVDIATHSIKADYIYSVAPKLDMDAFLMARLTGWEELSLLPGEANIFFEGTFVSKSFVDPGTIKDTLMLSLGRDKRVIVKREKVKDFTTRKTVASNQRDAYAFMISVRNSKAEAIKLIVEDQVPISQNSQIEVSVIDAGNARYNKTTGMLEWELDVMPQETKSVTYKFEVKYPKDRVVSNLF